MSDLPPPKPASQGYSPEHFREDWDYAGAVMRANRGMSAAVFKVLSSASRQLLELARQLSTGGKATDLQLAVIFAQSACELHTEQALSDLLRHRAPPLNEVVLSLCGSTISLADTRARKVWSALTGDYPAGHAKLPRPATTWWLEWKDNRRFRNHVAHEGAAVTSAEAARSVELAELYMNHVTNTAAATLARTA